MSELDVVSTMRCAFVVINQPGAMGTGFQSPYPSRTHKKTCGNPHRIPIPLPTVRENRVSFNAHFSVLDHLLAVSPVKVDFLDEKKQKLILKTEHQFNTSV